MEFSKILMAAIFVVTLSSVAHAAPRRLCRHQKRFPSSPGRVELLFRLNLAPKIDNATKEMQTIYPFIMSSTYLINPVIYFGNVGQSYCTINTPLKDKLSITYMKMAYFVSPMYMAYSYEEQKGPQPTQLAQVLIDASFYVNTTYAVLRHKILDKKFPLPNTRTDSEAKLDNYTRKYLQGFVDKKLVSLAITDDVVKTFRNYVIIYSLYDAINDLFECVAFM